MNRLIIVMGVSGSGKSLVGSHLGKLLECDFIDGDDLHPADNVERMRAGIKLDDVTRKPWLAAICESAEEHFAADSSVVIACSALKKKYRTQLRSVSGPTLFIFLNGSKDLIRGRLEKRTGHYMPPSLLDSQFGDLECPADEADVLEINIDQNIKDMLADVASRVS